MVSLIPRAFAWLEITVIVLQVMGVGALLMNRLADSKRWAERGQLGFIVAMIGLGVMGALCGRHGSDFGLFAGGTMTLLLIGMTIGSEPTPTIERRRSLAIVEPTLMA